MGISKETRRHSSGPQADIDFQTFEAAMAKPIGKITSRDDIIDPYSLVDPSMYDMTRRGKAAYKSDLDRAKYYAEQQEAAYQEWYDSPEAAAQRERDAGRNPNLIEYQLGSSDAADAVLPEGSPMADIQSNGQVAAQAIGTAAAVIGTIVGSVATLGALPSAIAAATATAGAATAAAGASQAAANASTIAAQGQEIANIASFEKNVYGAAAANLADAMALAAQKGESFDFQKWLDDPNSTAGIFESYAPSGVTVDNPQYGSAYRRAISNIQKHKGASYAINNEAVAGQSNFARALSDPYFNDDLLIQMAYLEPLMQYEEQARLLQIDYQTKLAQIKGLYLDNLDVSSAAEASNASFDKQKAEYKYYTDYFNGFEGDEVALYEFTMKKSQALQEYYSEQINNNYWSIWKRDPSSTVGMSAAYLIQAKNYRDWKAFIGAAGAVNLTDPERLEGVDTVVPRPGGGLYGRVMSGDTSGPGSYRGVPYNPLAIPTPGGWD